MSEEREAMNTGELLSDDRDAIYDEYAKEHATETGLPAPEENTGDTKEEPKPDVTETAPADAEDKDKGQATPETADGAGALAPPKEEKHDKFVPLEALHAEREKRKSERAQKEALESRLKVLEQQLSAPKTSDDVYVDETEVLKQRVAMLEQQDAHRRQLEQLNSVREQQQRIQKMLKDTNDTLTKEGYPGFEYSVSAVTSELQKMVEEDESNTAFDNPTGWQKIYKEKIFPALRNSIISATRESEKAGKIELKKGAGLATSHGSPAQQKDDSKPKTPDEGADDYMAMRMKRSF